MSTLRQLQGDVARRLRRGDSFAAVEEQVIDRSPLSDEEKAALWLYGWSFVSRPRQRSEAVAHIDRLEGAVARRPSEPTRRARIGIRQERAGSSRREASEDRVEDLQRSVRRLLDDRPALRRSLLRPADET